MWVIRTIVDMGDKPDFKVFSKREGAQKFLQPLATQALHDEIQSVAAFKVHNTDDVYAAVEAVKSGNNRRVSLLRLFEDLDTRVDKLGQIDLELENGDNDSDNQGS